MSDLHDQKMPKPISRLIEPTTNALFFLFFGLIVGFVFAIPVLTPFDKSNQILGSAIGAGFSGLVVLLAVIMTDRYHRLRDAEIERNRRAGLAAVFYIEILQMNMISFNLQNYLKEKRENHTYSN